MRPKSASSRKIRSHIVATAGHLFYRRGLRAVGVNEIVDSAQIAKATLYRHFRSKESLILATLSKRSERLQKAIDDALRLAGSTPERQLAAIFGELNRTAREPGFRGCAFMRALAEINYDEGIRKAVSEYKAFIRDTFLRVCEGSVANPADLAEELAILYEGAVALAVIRPEASPANVAMKAAGSLLAAATPPSTI